jgi:hypothetical protein
MPTDFVLIRTCNDLQEASVLRSVLEGSGIEALIADENFASLYPGVMITAGGVRLLVRAGDLERANEVLDATTDTPGSASEPDSPVNSTRTPPSDNLQHQDED